MYYLKLFIRVKCVTACFCNCNADTGNNVANSSDRATVGGA